MFLVTHAAPPEHAVKLWLELHLPLAGLKHRQIDCPVIHGHPVYQEGISQEGIDAAFPKIGVEWTRDMRTDYLGENFEEFRPDDEWRARLNDYKKLPQSQRAASDQMIDQLTVAPWIQKWSHSVKSEVLIAGFASGGQGRNTSKALYETVEGLLSPMGHDLEEAFPGVSQIYSENAETSIQVDNFASPVYGWEIMIHLVQVRTIYRERPAYLFTDNPQFDIHMEDSRTIWKTRGVFDFEPVRGAN